jgi:hypothetical protein
VNRRRLVAGIAACIGGMLFGAHSSIATFETVRVYLVRGLFSVSPGLGPLAEKLAALGIQVSVHSYVEAGELAARAAREYKESPGGQIMLIGHSAGGSAVLWMADDLKRADVPVALLIAIDAPSAWPVPSNVQRAVGLYVSNGVGVPVMAGEGFRGRLENIDFKDDPEIGHFAIISSLKMQSRLIDYVTTSLPVSAEKPAPSPAPARPNGQRFAGPRDSNHPPARRQAHRHTSVLRSTWRR